MRKLIIGKNSKVVSMLFSELDDFDYISHTEVEKVDFARYAYVFLFSWDYRSIENNILLVDKIPPGKLIFISSVAVFSLVVGAQWNNYPEDKLFIEKYVRRKGGSVYRLGFVEGVLPTNLVGSFPYTSIKQLARYLLQPEAGVVNIFRLDNSSKNENKILKALQVWIPRIKPLRFAFDAFVKYFTSQPYSYTSDVLRLFGNSCQIGYGVLGSEYWKKYSSDILVVSPFPDLKLDQDGFLGTIIGKNINGLAKFWHQVYITGRGEIRRKKVPLFKKWRRLPKATLIADVSSVAFLNNDFHILIRNTNEIENLVLLSHKLVLSAGAIENCKLATKLVNHKGECTFQDHDIGCIGTISSEELIAKGFLGKYGPFLFGRKVLVSDALNSLFDFRPFNAASMEKPDTFYINKTDGILWKLFTGFSFSRLNEAFFNKFGLCCFTKSFTVFTQVANYNAIKLKSDGSLSRSRANQVLADLGSFMSARFDTYLVNENVKFVDGVHVVGGEELTHYPILKNLRNDGRLVCLAAPFSRRLKAVHHTKMLIDEIHGSR